MKITVDDLLEDCAECKGTGQKNQPAGSRGGNSFGPNVVAVYGDLSCPACRGLKKRPTESGRAISELFAHLQEFDRLPR